MSSGEEFVTADVLIVGGGIAGPALAARLAPTGWNIILIERNAAAIDTARGDHLQPYIAELLDRWGLLERFMAAGAEKRKGTVWKSVDPFTIQSGNALCLGGSSASLCLSAAQVTAVSCRPWRLEGEHM